MTRKITLLAIVPAFALGLSACGSSNTSPGASSATSSVTSSVAPTPSSSSTSSSMPMPMPSKSSVTSTSPKPSASNKPQPPASKPKPATKPVITIVDFAYKVPASVAPGAKIAIMNADSEAHTVTSKTGGFDVKVFPNATVTLTAPSKPGRYSFVCTFHADMASTLVVR